MDYNLKALKEEYHFDIYITYCARSLVRLKAVANESRGSNNKLELAYVLCINETKKWFGLGSYIGLSDIPDIPRFNVLRDVLSAMIIDGIVDNIETKVSLRRLQVSGTLADRLNTIYNKTLEGTKQ